MAQPLLERYDYLIVGAGPAGCLLANRLSADPGVSVLLIEAEVVTTIPGSISRSVTSIASAIRVPTGASAPRPIRACTDAR